MSVAIAPDVLAVLDAATVEGNRLHLGSQLDRSLYVRTDKILTLLGGRWNRSARAHVFPADAADVVTAAILAGEVTDAKRDFDAFFTPGDLASSIAHRADITQGMTVLEPSAGAGALALAARQAGAHVSCIELQAAQAAQLRGLGFAVLESDFLQVAPTPPLFDRVVMNPPFSKQRDILHVLHAHRFLKPSGLLVSVMSASVTFRTNALTRRFREFVEAHAGSVESLAPGAFKAAGTMVNTVLVTLPGSARAEH